MIRRLLDWLGLARKVDAHGPVDASRRGFLAGAVATVVLAPLGLTWKPRELTKEELIAQFIRTPEGRAELAQSMVQPLRRRVDYAEIGRKAFYVEPLPQGALPLYMVDVDVDVAETVVGES